MTVVQTIRNLTRNWAMLDQAVVSCGNFVLSFLLARWLRAPEYGAFVLIFGILQVTNVIHQSVISYPISVLGAQKSRAELPAFAAQSLLLTSAIDCVLAVAMALIAWYMGGTSLAVICTLAMVAVHVQETYRRTLMCHLQHRAAVAGDAVMFLGQVAGVLVVHRFFELSLEAVFFCVFVVASLGALVQMFEVGWESQQIGATFRNFSSFWTLGRWPLMANIGYSLTMQAFPWLLARQGLAMAASFQAVLNVVAFTNPIGSSIGNLLVPAVAHKMLLPDGAASARKLTRKYVLIGLALLSPFLLTALIIPGKALVLFYGAASQYAVYTRPLQMLAGGCGLACISHVAGCYFLGSKRPQIVLWSQLIGCGVAVLFAPLAMSLYGVAGAAAAFLGMGVVRLTVLILEFRRDAGMSGGNRAVVEQAAIRVGQGH